MNLEETLALDNAAFNANAWRFCSLCHEFFPAHEVTTLHGSVEHPYVFEGDVCSPCMPQAINYYRAECPLCGVVGHSTGDFQSRGVCPMCHEQYLWRPDECVRVSKQLTRARKNGLADTLKVAEWIQTLIDFGRRCAYCGGPYTLMDHYVPIRLGGGTTAQNCVPACVACNFSKERDQSTRVSPQKLEEVGVYLANRVQRMPVTTARVGKVFPVLARYMPREVSADNPFVDRLEALLGL